MHDIQITIGLIEQLIEITKEAGKAILEVYNTNFDYQIKEDLSPLTKADTLSNKIICERLKALTPDTPILSEESSDVPFHTRSLWKQYWLVDPLDGTKEFINRNGEFTVNIALINNNEPVFGVIYIPVNNRLFWGSRNYGSYEINNGIGERQIHVADKNLKKIACSRSHGNPEFNNFLEKLDTYSTIKIGSSLKFCLIANGEIDIYPRLGPTSEWDIAAGEAILRSAGGCIIDLEEKNILYNKKNIINPSFIAASNLHTAGEILNLITIKENNK
tara:strand:- start:30 stop:851 length:822 start_codon:yes stop_codon:yes gene_type:complete